MSENPLQELIDGHDLGAEAKPDADRTKYPCGLAASIAMETPSVARAMAEGISSPPRPTDTASARKRRRAKHHG